LRAIRALPRPARGTPPASSARMRHRDPSWTVPLHVTMWSLLSLGVIAVLVVVMLH